MAVTKPLLMPTLDTITDVQSTFTGNIMTSAVDADPNAVLKVLNVGAAGNSGFVAGTVGGGKGTNTFVGQYGTLVINQDGTYTYTAKDGLNLKAGEIDTDVFAIKIADQNNNYSSATLKIVVTGTQNLAPSAQNHYYTISSGTTYSGDLLDGATDPNHDLLSVASIITDVQGAHGNNHLSSAGTYTIDGVYGTLTVSTDGHFTYALNAASVGTHNTDHFAYKVYDGQSGEGHNFDYAVFDVTF